MRKIYRKKAFINVHYVYKGQHCAVIPTVIFTKSLQNRKKLTFTPCGCLSRVKRVYRILDTTTLFIALISCVTLNLFSLIPRLHDEAGSTSARRAGLMSWLSGHLNGAILQTFTKLLVERSTSARRASSSSQLHRVNGVLVSCRPCTKSSTAATNNEDLSLRMRTDYLTISFHAAA